MTFLDPIRLALLGLLAAVVAVYLLRMPRRRLRVPDAGIARDALADRASVNRERRTLISLAFQVVILALLALAAAMPFLGSGEKRDRSLIVLLDVSASMRADDSVKFHVLGGDNEQVAGASTRFRRAVDAVRGLARGMGRGDRMMLVTVARTTDVALNLESDPGIIDRVLATLSPTAEEANFADAAKLAAEIARSQSSAEVWLVTDAAVKPADLAPLAALGLESLKLVSVGGAAGNIGITGFRVRRNLDSPTDYEAIVTLTNAFDEPRDVEIQLLLDGEVFDLTKGLVRVPARGEAVHVFREKLHVGGVLEAKLRVADALAEDNVAWEILRGPKRLRVLLVTDDTSESSFLVRAVGSNAGAVEGMILTPEQYRKSIAPNPAVLRGQRDAVIFDRWAPAKADELPPTHLLTIDCVPPGMPVAAGESFDKPLIRKWEQGHPLMSYLNLRNVFITTARRVTVAEPKKGEPPVERVAEMVTSPLVLAWEHEMPVLVGGRPRVAPSSENGEAGRTHGSAPTKRTAQRYVVIAFNPRESDIVLRKELPLLLWNSLQWFQLDSEPESQAAPGTTIALAAGSDGQDTNVAKVTTPSGRVVSTPVDSASGAALFSDTSEAGVYRWRIGSKQDAFAVNLGCRGESDVRAQDLGLKAQVVDAAKLASANPGGRALWPWLLLAAGILLAVEAVLFHRRVFF